MTNIEKDIKILHVQAEKLRDQGVYFQAIELFKKLLVFYKKKKDEYKYGRSLFQIGLCYRMAGENKKALEALNIALDFYEKRKMIDRIGYTYREIGTVYLNLNKFISAKKWFTKSVNVLENTSDQDSYGMSLARLGLIEMHLKNYPLAEKLMLQGLELTRTDSQWFFEVTVLYFLGKLCFFRKKYHQAIKYLEEAEAILNQNKQAEIHTRRYGQIWGILGYCHLRLGEIELAKEYFLDALEHLFAMPNNVASLIYQTIQAPEFFQELEKNGLKKQ